MTSDTLLPCPFCGSDKVVVTRKAEKAVNTGIHCTGCGASYSGENWNKRVMAAPRGCVCPPTCEQTCMSPTCPRQPPKTDA